jgi:hypothetical protein
MSSAPFVRRSTTPSRKAVANRSNSPGTAEKSDCGFRGDIGSNGGCCNSGGFVGDAKATLIPGRSGFLGDVGLANAIALALSRSAVWSTILSSKVGFTAIAYDDKRDADIFT